MNEPIGESSRWTKSRWPLLPLVLGAVFLLATVASPVDAIGKQRTTSVSPVDAIITSLTAPERFVMPEGSSPFTT